MTYFVVAFVAKTFHKNCLNFLIKTASVIVYSHKMLKPDQLGWLIYWHITPLYFKCLISQWLATNSNNKDFIDKMQTLKKRISGMFSVCCGTKPNKNLCNPKKYLYTCLTRYFFGLQKFLFNSGRKYVHLRNFNSMFDLICRFQKGNQIRKSGVFVIN